jgi:hypothetical protein
LRTVLDPWGAHLLRVIEASARLRRLGGHVLRLIIFVACQKRGRVCSALVHAYGKSREYAKLAAQQ